MNKDGKRVEVRVACIYDSKLPVWSVSAYLIEPGRRPFNVVAVGSSKVEMGNSEGGFDEETAIRLAIGALGEKVESGDYVLITEALADPLGFVVDRCEIATSTEGLFALKCRPRSNSAVDVAALRHKPRH
jgi:hypothetical protein